MALSEEDVQRIIAGLFAKVQLGVTPVNVEPPKVHGKRWTEKAEKGMGTYTGDRSKFSDWLLKTKMLLGAAEEKLLEMIEKTEKLEVPITYQKLDEFEELDGYHGRKWAKELYAILGGKLEDEAFTSVKNVDDQNGFEVWRRIRQDGNPSNPTVALMAIMDLIDVQRVEDERLLLKKIEEWEVKLKEVKNDHEESLTERMQIAVVSKMCSTKVIEVILQNAEKHKDYNSFKMTLRKVVENRVALNMNEVAADLAKVEKEDDWGEGHWQEHPIPGYELHWVQKGSGKGSGKICYNCDKPGHFSRECPLPRRDNKGKGKDSSQYKGGGKGYDAGKGGGAWGKGGGKSYFPFECRNCGIVGHKAIDCRKPPKGFGANAVDAEWKEGAGPEDPKEIAGCSWERMNPWDICAVSRDEGWSEGTTCEKGARKDFETMPKAKREEIELKNRFEMLNDSPTGEVMRWQSDEDLQKEKERNQKKFKESTNMFWQSVEDLEKEKESNQEKFKMPRFYRMTSQNEKKKATKEKIRLKEINAVGSDYKMKKLKVTIDSGAEESVWPWEGVDEKDVVETEASRKGLGFVAANGGKMKNRGAIRVNFEKDGKEKAMNFHVTDVKKPLGAVCRIAEKGNLVCFGPLPQHNYIMNIKTGEKITMVRERGNYVIEIDVKEGDAGFGRRE